jgi:peptidyl-prolyl cis-trans isomerase D
MRLSSIWITPVLHGWSFVTADSGGRMLQNIRDNSQGWIAKTIIGVIVALLALTGVDAIFQVTSNRQDAAEVNGQTISQNDLAQAAEMQRRQLMQRLGRILMPLCSTTKCSARRHSRV